MFDKPSEPDFSIIVPIRDEADNIHPLLNDIRLTMDHLLKPYPLCKTTEWRNSAKPLTRKLLPYIVSVIIPLTICGWLAYRPVLISYKKGYIKSAATNDRISLKAQKQIHLLKKLDHSNAADYKILQTKAIIMNQLHRHTQAYQLLKKSIASEHYSDTTIHKYIVYLLWLGEYDEAANLFKKQRVKCRVSRTVYPSASGALKKWSLICL
jgi:tetratricopeptide (TPR) repeat protein